MFNILASQATEIVYTLAVVIALGVVAFFLFKSVKKTYIEEKENKRMKIDGVITKSEMNSFISSYMNKSGGETTFSLIYVDLDKFEDFEIAFGKKEAQNIAKKCAKKIKDTLPTQTFLSRYAGDDFMVFMPRQYNRNWRG